LDQTENRPQTVSRATVAMIAGWLKDQARPAAGRIIHHAAPGLDLVVGRDGPGVWWWRGRPRGLRPDGTRWPPRTLKLGDTDTHSLASALHEAAKLRLQVTQGGDPGEDRRRTVQARQAAAVAAKARMTCRQALNAYSSNLATRDLSRSHFRNELGQVRLALDSIGMLDTPISAISSAAVGKILALCPPKSRQLRFGALDRFLDWGLRQEGTKAVAPTSLLSKRERPKPVASRERVLAVDELASVWRAMEQYSSESVRDLLLFMVTTPARENEVASMCWRDVDLAAATWTQPTSKNRLRHRYPLNERAMQILQRRHWVLRGQPRSDALVFPGPLNGRAFVGWSKAKAALDKRLTIAPWRFHDLRRSFVTLMAEAGHAVTLLDLTINHAHARTSNRMTGAYDLSQLWPARVMLLTAWSGFLDTALAGGHTGTTGASIVQLRHAQPADTAGNGA
jgi:integrase